MLLALSLASCRTVRKVQSQSLVQSEDSSTSRSSLREATARITRKVTWTEPIPADTATLSLDLASLASLPTGAQYSARSGRVSLRAWQQPSQEGKQPQIIIEASCDSLQRLCWAYEQREDSMSAQIALLQKQTSESRSNDVRTESRHPPEWLVDLGVIVIACLLAGLYLMYKKKSKQHE